MALTRSFLKGMGLTDEQVSAIVEAHGETVDALKEQRDDAKKKSAEYDKIKKELDDLKESGGDWQTKYEKEHSDFESYKKTQEEKESKRAISKAYKELLKNAGVSEKRIATVMKVADLSKIQLDENGAVKDSEKLTENIKSEWADFIVTTNTEGASTSTPPGTNESGKDVSKMTMEEYIAARKNKEI